MIALWIALGVLALFLIVDIVFSAVLVKMVFVRKKMPPEAERVDNQPESWKDYGEAIKVGLKWLDENYKLEKWELRAFDGTKLRANYLAASTKTNRTILCVHGYTGSGRFDFGLIDKFLVSTGCNILFVDCRAHGESDGTYIGFSVLDRRDCADWCRFIVDKNGSDSKILLYGVSMGAATVLSASGDDNLPKQVVGVCGDCGFSSAWDEVVGEYKHLFKRLPVFPFVHTANLILQIFAGYSLTMYPAKEMIKRTKIPLLIIHGKDDTFVPTAMGEEIYANAKCDKKLLLVDGAIHAHSYLVNPSAYEAAFTDLLRRSGM